MSRSIQTTGELPRRMIGDMRMRKHCDKIQSSYIRAVHKLAGYLGRSPDGAIIEDLRNFQLHLVDSLCRSGRGEHYRQVGMA